MSDSILGNDNKQGSLDRGLLRTGPKFPIFRGPVPVRDLKIGPWIPDH